jgi:hypothetical protein
MKESRARGEEIDEEEEKKRPKRKPKEGKGGGERDSRHQFAIFQCRRQRL